MSDASLWIVAYDIAGPARLRAIATLCEDYGRRLQQSVFLCSCSANQIEELRASLKARLEPSVDHLALLPLCKRCKDNIVQDGIQKTLPGSTSTMVI